MGSKNNTFEIFRYFQTKIRSLTSSNMYTYTMYVPTDYGRPVRKSSSLHSPKPTPAPKIF